MTYNPGWSKMKSLPLMTATHSVVSGHYMSRNVFIIIYIYICTHSHWNQSSSTYHPLVEFVVETSDWFAYPTDSLHEINPSREFMSWIVLFTNSQLLTSAVHRLIIVLMVYISPQKQKERLVNLPPPKRMRMDSFSVCTGLVSSFLVHFEPDKMLEEKHGERVGKPSYWPLLELDA